MPVISVRTPTSAEPPTTSFTDQVTRVSKFPTPLTCAVNNCDEPAVMFPDEGLIVIEVTRPETKDIELEPNLEGSAMLVALILTVTGETTCAGAVYRPDVEMEPLVAGPEPPTIDHCTLESKLPVP